MDGGSTFMRAFQNFKCTEVSNLCSLLPFDVWTGEGRGFVNQCSAEEIQLCTLSLRMDFNAAKNVAHPSVDLVTLCKQVDKRSETDPLYASAEQPFNSVIPAKAGIQGIQWLTGFRPSPE